MTLHVEMLIWPVENFQRPLKKMRTKGIMLLVIILFRKNSTINGHTNKGKGSGDES